MDFLQSAGVLVPALWGLAVTVLDEGDGAALAAFESTCAFAPALQPLLTADGLRRFFAARGAEHIYAAQDALDIHAVLLRIGARWVVLGPYVPSPWNESEARVLLARGGLGDAALVPYKGYRCRLPILDRELVVRVAALLLTNTVDDPPRELEIVDLAARTADDLPPQIADAYSDFAQTERRYAWEEELMDAVRRGQTARALALFKDMDSVMAGIRFLSGSIGDRIAGTCTMRALVRRASLQAGLTPVFVDALSQEYAQQMHRAADDARLDALIRQYITAFCRAVRENARTDYSPHVQQAVQYIALHLSAPLTVEELCRLTGVTRQHLGALFRAETGGTVKQYIARARCERAAGLLRDSRLQVQEVARYVGYEDTAYFARVFKAVTGRTPQEYRREMSVF